MKERNVLVKVKFKTALKVEDIQRAIYHQIYFHCFTDAKHIHVKVVRDKK